MVDISQFTVSESDQLNADDLREDGRLGGPITVKIVRVTGTNDKEQPIAIHYEGDGGRPYKPGKSMRRVLKAFWGKETDNYPGRFLTLYCDKRVEFGNLKVGGVRISHMSDVEETSTVILAKRGAKIRYDVKRLTPSANGGQQRKATRTPAEQADAYIAGVDAAKTPDELIAYQQDERRVEWLGKLKVADPVEWQRVVDAQSARGQALRPADDEGGRTDGQHGDQHPGDDDDDDGFPGDPS